MDRKFTSNLEMLSLENQKQVPTMESNAKTRHAGSTEVPPAKRVFSIDSLLAKIVHNLCVKDLKNVRFTCSKFNNVVLDKFEEPGFLTLEGIYCRDESTTPKVCYFTVVHEHTTLEWQLPNLINVIKSSSRFPIQDFSFHHGSVKDPLLQEFFSLYGSRIRKLYLPVHLPKIHWSLNPEICSTPEDIFTILRNIPNVENLELTEIPQTEQWTEGNVPENIQNENKESSEMQNSDISTYSRFVLPNLETLNLFYTAPDWFILPLIESAPKLKGVNVMWHRRKNLLIQSNKLHLLTSLVFNLKTEVASDYDLISSHSSVSLSQMLIYAGGVVTSPPGPILSKLFHSNQYTLKSIALHPLGNYSQLQIPQLPKVVKLKIFNHYGTATIEKLLPPNVEMFEIFPNLKSLIIKFWLRETEALFQTNPAPIPTVKSLTFECDQLGNVQPGKMYSSDVMDFFAKLCPQATTAEFKYIETFQNDSGDIWKIFKNLTHLKFSFNTSRMSGINDNTQFTLHSIDSFFTGISVNNLKRLSKWKLDGIGKAELFQKIEEMRNHPSILFLKDLKRLQIVVYNEQWSYVREGGGALHAFVPALTDASKHFGFNFSTQLLVSLAINLQIRSHLPEWREVTKSLLTKPLLQQV